MTARQLPLTDRPTIEPFPERLRDPVYLGFAFDPKARPAESCAIAIDAYARRKGTPPRHLICHPSYAEVVGQECQGIPVLGEGRARYVVLVGPQEG
jgi:hypothetical protein